MALSVAKVTGKVRSHEGQHNDSMSKYAYLFKGLNLKRVAITAPITVDPSFTSAFHPTFSAFHRYFIDAAASAHYSCFHPIAILAKRGGEISWK